MSTYVTNIHEAQISLRFTLRPAVFDIQANMRQVHRMTAKWSWTHKKSNVPHICVTRIHELKISVRFTLRPAIQTILRKVHRMTPKLHWRLEGQMYPICVTSIPKSQIHPVSLYDSHFRDAGHFDKSAPNDATWPSTRKGQIYPICVTSIPESQISPMCILRPSTEGPQNDIEHYKVKVTPRYVLLVSLSPKFHSILLYGQPFSSYMPFWTSVTNDSKNKLNPTRSNVPHTYVARIPDSLISVRFALRPDVFEIKPFWEKSAANDPKWHWTIQGQMYPMHMCY